MGFKPGDGSHLCIATGDGGSGNDPSNTAQNTGVLLGKLLRININDFASPSINDAIPGDNPSSAWPVLAARFSPPACATPGAPTSTA